MKRGQGQLYGASRYSFSLEKLRSKYIRDMDLSVLDVGTKAKALKIRGPSAAPSPSGVGR